MCLTEKLRAIVNYFTISSHDFQIQTAVDSILIRPVIKVKRISKVEIEI
jgi:hypothetical protein